MAKKSTTPKPEQLKIAGTHRTDRIQEIDEAADAYRQARDLRMAHGLEELERKAELLELMQTHKRERYVYEDAQGDLEEVVLIAEEVTVKVRKCKSADPKGDD